MRHWNDLHESLAAPSPIVPTGPPLCSLSSKHHHHQKHFLSSMSSKQHHQKPHPSAANSSQSLPYSGTEEQSHIKSDQDVADLVHYLQTQAASVSASSPPASFSSTEDSPPTGTGALEMFKAGHRRLRQLAQRQKKDAADPETKAEEDRLQLSALQREGLLSASTSASAAKKSHSKKGSVDSTPSDSKSVSHASCKSSSRREVERIGQPWLTDPLERCMADPLMSSGHVPSLDLSHLNSSVENAVAQESAETEKTLPFQPLTLPDFIANGRRDSAQQALDGFLEHAGKTSPTANAFPSSDADKESKPAHPSETNATEKTNPESSDSTAKPKPAPKNTLKLFPDPVPPRLSSKTAWRLSTVPPANPLQPRSQQRLPTLNETSRSALPSPTAPHAKERTPKEPRSAPAATSQFTGVEREKASENAEQSSNDKQSHRYSTLPMNAINAFPLPAPTRPLPSLPPSAAAEAKASKKKGRAVRNVSSPASDRSNQPTETARLAPNRPANSATPEPAQERNRVEKVPASRVKEMAQHLDVAASGEAENRSRSFDVPRPDELKEHEKRRSFEVNQWVQRDAVPGPLPTPPLHSHTHPSGRSVPTSPMLPPKHSEQMLEPAPREGQLHRSHSHREPTRSDKKTDEHNSDLRSEYPIPSSDEEGIARSPWPGQAQKKRRRAKPQKPIDLAQPAQRVPRIEKPTQPESTSPQNNRNSRSFGRSSPQSQYSQCTYHSHDSNTLSVLEGRIAQLERQNKVLQAALLAALNAGNKDSTESLVSGTVASLLSAPSVPSPKTTPVSSYDERTEKSKRRRSWLDTSSRRSSASSHGENMDFGWLSDKSSVVDSFRMRS